MGDCGSKRTVDEKVQITTTLAESKSSNEEKLIMKPEFDSISEQKPDSLYPPLSELEKSSEIIVFDSRRGSSSEDCAKKCPSAGYNFSRNSTFEASNQQYIHVAANNITTGITDSKSLINNN